MRAAETRRIGILTFADAELLDVAGPLNVFSVANALQRARRRPDAYEIVLLAPHRGPVPTTSGFALGPVREFRRAGRGLDTLMIAGGSDAGVEALLRTRGLLAWLKRTAATTRRVGSVCTGAFVLAAAGLLDGRRATTHWSAAEELRRRHPAVDVEIDALYVRDGRFFTAAGISAGMDLALALVEEDLGRRLALAVARRMVLFLKRPGGQSQFSSHLAAQSVRGDRFESLLAWMNENPAADLSVPALADQAAMSPRHFARVFTSQVRTTPAKFVERVRLDYARRRLEETDEPLKQVAAACGFGTAETLRRTMTRHLRVSPERYRARFRREEQRR